MIFSKFRQLFINSFKKVATNPPALEKAIYKALNVVRKRVGHDLPRGYKEAIWSAMGEDYNLSYPLEMKGHSTRTNLAIKTTNHVLSIWEKVWPKDRTPHMLIEEAKNLIKKSTDKEIIQNKIERAWVYMDNRAGEDPGAAMAGYAAVVTLAVAQFDENFDPENINYEITDDELEPEEHDVASLASMAYANGGVWDPASDANKRLKFWEWWLNDAVPASWQETTDE